jgi:hypothetical protein
MKELRTGGTDGNEALTAITAVALTGLLLAEGVTILFMGGLRVEHMFIGVVLLGPVAIKLASTGYRFVRYYTGAAPYRAKGPPPLALRLIGPVLVATTVLVFATGVALLLVGHRSDLLLTVHKVSFIVWGACFAIHFLWHLTGAWRAAGPQRPRAPGGLLRAIVLGASLGGGATLALILLSAMQAWHGGHHHHPG